jgi:CSLREA domain-containing protein
MVRSVPIAILVAVFGCLPGAGLATTFNVTKTADTNDGACNADCSLREAIVAANANAGPDDVAVPAGSYVLSIAGTNENAGATGDLDVSGDLALTGAGAGSTTIVGNGADRVLDVLSGASATVSDVTITNGGAVELGGGVRNAGTLLLADSTISGNKAQGTLPIINVIGGGVGTVDAGVTTISNCLVTGNEATGDGDAGAAIGGGVGAFDGETIVESSTITDNLTYATSLTAPGIGGGIGIVDGTLSVHSSTVSGNDVIGFAAAAGGGVGVACEIFFPCGSISVRASTIVDNEAFASGEATGGGAFFAAGSFLIANSTLANNAAATGPAPGVGTPAPGANLEIQGSMGTVANVTVEAGSGSSGVHSLGGDTTFRNTIVADTCAGFGFSGNAHNLEYPGNTCGFSGTDLIGVNPLLGALANNGGPTQTMKLSAGSAAISGGDPGTPGSGGNTCETSDQRGVSRPVGARCDIGAYESECGDGDGDAGEACDEGVANGSLASCCSAACVVRPNNAACDDGNVCTSLDKCQGGVCTSGPCRTGACTYCGGTCSDAGGPCECVY